MAERTWIQQTVERVVSQVLESHITFLRDDLVRRVMQELQPILEAAPVAAAGGAPHSMPPMPEPIQASVQAVPVPAVAEAAAPMAQAAAAAAAAAIPGPQLSPEEQEVHKKAQRFAKLLVDEIKLYNQAKVTEGRKQKDLYDRLKDDIEKSRAIYKKRYVGTAAESSDYFREALVRILADNDSSLLGANFPR
ncbi:MAG TPA: hypothetical protein VFB00_11160 [Terriglobales bacterium]|nr:hypothetical protein [Terriglobales bacterium]